MKCQSHEVGIQRSDSLKHEPDVAGGGEVKQCRGGVICTGSTVDQRRVDLQREAQLNHDTEDCNMSIILWELKQKNRRTNKTKQNKKTSSTTSV